MSTILSTHEYAHRWREWLPWEESQHGHCSVLPSAVDIRAPAAEGGLSLKLFA